MKTKRFKTSFAGPGECRGSVTSKSLVLAGVLTAGLFAQQPVHAALTFSFNYIDPGTSFGFYDSTYGNDRRLALEAAANDLGSYFTAYNAHLTFDVTSENKPGTGILAGAGSGIDITPGGFRNTVVQEKILSNGATDLNGTDADGYIGWNFSSDVKWDTSDSVASDSYDFKSTAMHELLHAFGFTSSVDEGGKGANGNSPGTADAWNIFDKFLTDKNGDRLVDDSGVFDSTKVGTLTGGTTDGVFFSGPNAMAANGGNRVNIYSPPTYSSGSSISHLDDDYFTSKALLMESATLTGPGTRVLSDIELGILKDIGYSKVAPVPVPAAVWLMGSGLVALFGMARRRRMAAA